METLPAAKRSVGGVAVLALASLCCLAFATRAADEKKTTAREAGDAAHQGQSLFNGKDLSGWEFADKSHAEIWKVAHAELDPNDHKKLRAAEGNAKSGGDMFRGDGAGTDIYTDKSFGDVQLHVEFMIPEHSNSGVYLMGQYEVQILSNFGKADDKLGPGDCGGIYTIKAPKTNALKPYGQWNTYDIAFRAPRFDSSGKKTEDARFVKVTFNGQVIHENVEAPHPTGGELRGGEKAKGPLMLQGNHGSVAFRNIMIKEVEMK